MNYGLDGRVAIVTGGGGAICGAIGSALAAEGVRVAIWDLSPDAADRRCGTIREKGGDALAVQCDVLDEQSVRLALDCTLDAFGRIDILLNGAGGSRPEATTAPDRSLFDLRPADIERTVRLNYLSAVIPAQQVGAVFARQSSGVIVNISSIAAICPLTRAIGYSNGKAATNSLTQWLAVHMARDYSPAIRVNAIAPGFVLTEQNRFLLEDPQTGEVTDRGRSIIANVPAGRYGRPDEMIGAALWLVSDLASYVTGAVIPVDGGFTAFSGV